MDKELMPDAAMKLCSDLRKESGSIVDKWEKIGHSLKLPPEKLQAIGDQKNKEPKQYFYAVINEWLHRRGLQPVTRRVLVSVLESADVDEGRLAKVLKGGKSYSESTKKVVTLSDRPTDKKLADVKKELPKPILENYLRMYYCKASQHQKDEWPPSFNIEYISQVLVQQSRMPQPEVLAREAITLTTKGQIEAIEGDRLSLENIMTSNESNERVCLVIGAPGVGKTRLGLKLCKDWGNKELLGNFHLLLYIPLREPIARLSESIDELLKYFDDNCNEGDSDLIKKDHGKGVLFILDGWDELKLSCRGESQFFPKLIDGRILPGCHIIVTSRPGASEDIRHHANKVIEILGFGESHVNEYIQAYFSSHAHNGASKLISDLGEYPNVASTCYIAINLAIVCHVYHARGCSLPETLTEVYEWFIIHTILRFLRKKKIADEICSELPSLDNTKDFYSEEFRENLRRKFGVNLWDTLRNIGKLALNGVENSDLCFRRQDLVKICNLDARDREFDGFGLLKPVQISHSVSSELSYHFLHLSIQEYMAAFYLEMEASEQMRYLIQNERKYDAVIRFFCGINQFKSEFLRIFFRSVKTTRLFHFECVYEGQWKEHCQMIAKQCSNSFKLHGINLLPRQWAVLGYVMANSETKWHFEWFKLYPEEKDLKCFRRHLSNPRSFYYFSLKDVKIKPRAIEHLSEICRSQVCLSELAISNCHLSDEGLLTVLNVLEQHESLRSLTLQDTTVTPQVLDAILRLLPTLPKIERVELNFPKFLDKDYLSISNCASKSCKTRPHIVTPNDSLGHESSSSKVGVNEESLTSHLSECLSAKENQQQVTQKECEEHGIGGGEQWGKIGMSEVKKMEKISQPLVPSDKVSNWLPGDLGTPTLPKLIAFPIPNDKINLAEKISTDYSKFGILLLNDEDGSVISAIVKEKREKAEDINQEIFRLWLQGSGRTVSWATLVEVLQIIKQNELAKRIQKSLEQTPLA